MLRDVRIYFTAGETALIRKIAGGEALERLVDLSLNGIAIMSANEYKKNEIVKIELELSGQHLALKGAVKRWQEEKKYIEFIYLNDDNREALEWLLNRFGELPK
ncbi:MAG: PilZ domain-containing protein [Spirochaetes bacterium]|nr:PilZ domain-containing protein [Spirochaetota bacterium]